MNIIIVLAIILAICMLIIGGKKGLRSFIALFLNFIVVIVLLFFMNVPQFNPILLTFIACIVVSIINLFYINEVNPMTKIAFVSTLATTGFLVVLIWLFTKSSLIQGFGEEETEELSMMSLHIGLDFQQIVISVIIMSTIGAITDAAIAIASPMREMLTLHPEATRKQLFDFGMHIGRDIIGTSANTLFFAFFGSYLALLIWFNDLSYSLGEIVNSKIFSSELITICCAGIGVTLVIPITAFIASYFLKDTKEETHLS
ncbi:YibE/F [Kurthia sp. 3B1D]|uniref:YibE/F n=1 Tax=Candidatus Kurthia intestinigallinarum TaxID=1562256 RepID=A0A433RR71_9BACL|nr:YibE/F family protein [Kurthia sp. 3B1D]RUS53681.1 YibE/F [Kurthia sp. 3B1D]HIX43020.1 YibE/F family protein [Candidatus Kurthia intestinigallinarum]